MTTQLLAALLVGFVVVRPAVAQTTLAEAAASTAKIHDARPLSTNAPAYTNRDLPATVPVAPTARSAAGLAPANPAGAVDTPAAEPLVANGEAYWRGRMQALYTKLAGNLGDAHVNQHNLVNLQARAQATIIYLTVFGPEILRLHDEVTHWTAVVEEDYAAIAALEEEGRRDGALPGWLR
jgi:hypothetical protein